MWTRKTVQYSVSSGTVRACAVVPSRAAVAPSPRDLYQTAATLKGETRALRPTIRLLFFRAPLYALEDRLDAVSDDLLAIGLDIASAGVPRDFNSRVMVDAEISVNRAGHEVAHAVVREAYRDIADIRSRLDLLGSLAISLISLAVAIIAIFAG